ncbi:hypothetical protein EDF56_102299 [Novosphingobium sp. PhB165]|uniref:hypothetical protein n=1 Tax=Novosphingobium sp. PhB165 TaxID=2485105 RepID=UPI00104C6D3A|nr:hypothetical protein [Novosphingobium sp. PhB165]TCM20637.1 hypothetical protein EDF56_102299 [Novosphingobium sp. PhB165]
MSVVVDGPAIRLVGHCPVEDAEPLLVALQEDAGRVVHLGELEGAHFAVVQILLLCCPALEGFPKDLFLKNLVLPILGASASEQINADP